MGRQAVARSNLRSDDAAARETDPTAWAYRTIRRMVVESELPAAGRINQGKLADALRVSRTPVVKALHKLATEGLVVNIPQKGFYVQQFTIRELRNLFALREAVEAMAVEDLAATLTPEQARQLEGTFAPFGRGARAIDARAYGEADRRFHRMLLDLCRNNLAREVDRAFQILGRTLRAGLLRPPAETLAEHLRVIDALRSGDAEGARSAIIDHVRRTRKVLDEAMARLDALGIDPGALPVQQIQGDLLRGGTKEGR